MSLRSRSLARRAALLAAAVAPLWARTPLGAQETRLVLNADLARDTISRHVYGQFAEHLGRDIYDGVWTRTGSGPWHLRDDVIEALRRIKVPNIRWPGGCFADYYHWRDGIGPAARRPRMVNTIWGGVVEDNSFGTHEFMELVRRVGAEPFVVGNVGTGSPREMAEWWEYLNHPGGSTLSEERKANGHAAPFNVRWFGVGNESWGCGGNMRPEFYADHYRQFAEYLRAYGDSSRPFRVATGASGSDYRWTEVLMREAGRLMEGLDLHHYTVVGTWETKGPATGFDERRWFGAMQRALYVDELITRHSAIMDQFDPRKRVALIVGEWGMWHDPEPGSRPGFLYQQNSLRDALVAAVSLDVFNRHADRVRGANIAQMINVLQAMILTRGEQMILTPTYHVFDFYTVHQDALLLPLETLRAERYGMGSDSVQAVSASASRDRAGVIHLTMSNLDPTRARTVTVELRGARASRATGRVLTAPAIDSHNTFERPEVVRPAPFDGARITDGRLTVTLPAKSVVVLELR
ncbi:MAG TPA: alpha-L-arabinofuranosidase C-terminal domain-containing protein [Gemmatimonadaceae bacterium]|nr:alpha-L-arabinofuranosidase C-terminal domain-containing protein [Gemmatimonadaceae bacterium]